MSDEMENKSVEESVDTAEVTENVETADAPTEEVSEKETVEAAETETADASAEEAKEGTEALEEIVNEEGSVAGETKTAEERARKVRLNKKWFVLAAVAAAVILVIVNAPKIGNAAVKLFTSPAGYFQHVEGKTIEEGVESFAEAYDTAISSMFSVDDKGNSVEFGVELGEDVREMLGNAADIDFDWMEKVSLLMTADSTRDASKTTIGLALNNQQLISMLIMANIKDGVGYAQIPQLNESYLGMDLEEFLEMCDVNMDMDDINELYEAYDKIYKALPNPSKVEKVMKRYTSLALSCIEDVTQDKEEVTVGDYTDKYTVLEAAIDEKTVQSMLAVIVEEMKDHKDIKEILEEVLSVQSEVDTEDVYDEFLDALDDFEDVIDALDEEDFELIWKVYVDGKGDVYGRVFKVEDADVEVSSLMVKKGGKYAYEFAVEVSGAKVVLEGAGKMTSSKMDGDFKLKTLGMELAKIKLEDVKVKALEDGYFNGTMSLSLASVAAAEEMNGFPFDMEDLVLEIKADNGKNKSDVKLSLLEEDKLVGAVFVVSETGKAGKIKFPKEKEVVMLEDEEDILDWVGDIDLDAFLQSLEGKIDEDLLRLFEDALSGSVSLPNFDADYEEHSDDDDWY